MPTQRKNQPPCTLSSRLSIGAEGFSPSLHSGVACPPDAHKPVLEDGSPPAVSAPLGGRGMRILQPKSANVILVGGGDISISSAVTPWLE